MLPADAVGSVNGVEPQQDYGLMEQLSSWTFFLMESCSFFGSSAVTFEWVSVRTVCADLFE